MMVSKGALVMIHKKFPCPITVTAILIFTLEFVFFQLWENPFREVIRGVAVLSIYGVLIIGYLLCIALIFFGLFTLYRILWVRINGRNYKQVEV